MRYLILLCLLIVPAFADEKPKKPPTADKGKGAKKPAPLPTPSTDAQPIDGNPHALMDDPAAGYTFGDELHDPFPEDADGSVCRERCRGKGGSCVSDCQSGEKEDRAPKQPPGECAPGCHRTGTFGDGTPRCNCGPKG